ncbi:glutaconate CoA-transferase subunit A [Faunimonas pinastri]|uniref:Glutaconate CoA-transferase subunit A n=1 Tax=Faunimonas pinastri TaxID=1855383 RepID=A0A1H9EK03_9HYPH|nr:CoA-transferase [Faunimonas pinastri]SEQ26060.1 glutaconate CoA-transferase subunit A [Faunimonas pinastri]
MAQPSKIRSLADAVALIKDGDVVAIGGHTARRHPMALMREIIRQGRKDLHVVGWNNGIDMDMLVGAGCVSTVETSYVGIGSFGLARNFRRACETDGLRVIEHSETTAMDRFRAASIGLPLFPSKTGLGTDLPSTNPHLKPFTDPFTGETWMAVEAIRPDVAIVHAHTADEQGNVQLDPERWHDNSPDVMIARSARTVIVSVEQIVSEETVMSRPIDTILPRTDVTCIVEAPYGAHPCCCDARYDYDLEHLGRYHEATASQSGFAEWLADYVTGPADHWAYLEKIGARRLMEVSMKRTTR